MPSCLLDDRALVIVAGPEAEHFLQNIITTDLDALPEGEARPGALLTPQGKILFDFLVSRNGPGRFRLDCRKELASDFVRRLMLYRLRAKVEISVAEEAVTVAVWDNEAGALGSESTRLVDARFGSQRVWREYRASLPPPLTPPHKGEGDSAPFQPPTPGAGASEPPSPLRGGVKGGGTDEQGKTGGLEQWTELRIANGIAESGPDYALGDAFPHDVLLDELGGIGFKKGCYIGQEVVSRMQHRGTARRRVLIASSASPLPGAGTELLAAGKSVGVLGSVSGELALAIARIDKVKAAMDSGQPITADGVPVNLAIPAWARFTFPAAQSEDA